MLMASSFENEEEYEVIDDKNIHSKRCDVYDYVNGEIVQVGSIFSLSGYLSLYTKATEAYIATRINTHSVYFGGFSISKYEEKYLLVLTDNAGGDISYYGTKDDGSIGLVHELIWKGDAMEGDWYLDDEMISRETYEEYYNKYRSDSIWYGFSEESCNETIQEEISQTKDKLKM